MFKLTILSFVAMLIVMGMVSQNALAQGEVEIELPRAGITPESPLFFLDKFFESIQRTFTFGAEAKARLELGLASERLAEIKVMLEDKGVEARGIEIARSRMEDHLARTVSFVEDNRRNSSGDDSDSLAVSVNAEIRAKREALRRIFEDQKIGLKSQERDLETRIQEARNAGNDALVRELQAQRDAIKIRREALQNEREVQLRALNTQEDRLANQLGDRLQAQERINKAEFEKARLLERSSLRGIPFSQAEFQRLDAMLSQAKNAFSQGNLVEAENLVRQADLGFEILRESIDNDLNEDISGNADENELRGRANEPGEDIRGNADENEIRGRDNEIEAPGDQPRQEDRGLNNVIDDRGGNSGSGSSGRGGSDN